jgi:hypothetical protein
MMKITRLVFFILALAVPRLGVTLDPLPSWNEGKSKQAILNFVKAVSEVDSDGFVPVQERIAVFDQDGTLWVEHPLFPQFYFAVDNLKKMLFHKESYKNLIRTLVSLDIPSICEYTIQQVEELLTAMHAGLSVDEFHAVAIEWLSSARHPRFDRPFTELIYQPMLEVIRYLQDNQFKVFIVSGGGQEFIRAYAEQVYGIPPEQVIGSIGGVNFEYRDGQPMLVKKPFVRLLNDGKGKPEGINIVIGRRPIAAFGNSDGDQEMLEWTQGGTRRSFQLLVHHDDEVREYAYDNDTRIGKLSDALLVEAAANDWSVVSMKNDWNIFFPWETTK